MRHLKTGIMTVLTLLLLTACGNTRVDGSGTITTETRDISGPVTEISLSGVGTVDVTIGDELSVSVETDDNIQEYISTTVNDGILNLRIATPPGTGLNPSDGIEYTVVLPELTRLDIRGVTRAVVAGLDADSFEARISGNSTAIVSGETDTLTVTTTGSGSFSGFNLPATSVTASASGSSIVQVSASETLNADASGTATIVYQGDPTNLETDTSGTGDVRPVE